MGPEELGMHIRYVTSFVGAGAEAAYNMDKQLRASIERSTSTWAQQATVAKDSARVQADALAKVTISTKEKAQVAVDSAIKEKAAWHELANEYTAMARTAQRGSAIQVEAYKLAATAATKAGIQIRDAHLMAGAGGASGGTRSREARGLLSGAGGLGGRAVAFGSTAFLGGAVIGMGVKGIMDASKAEQVAQGQLQAALKVSNISWAANRAAINASLVAASKYSGFTRSDLTTSLTTLTRTTGSLTLAHRAQAAAIDLARGRNLDLQAATKMVMLAQEGHVGLLRRVGINLNVVTTAEDVLRQAHAKATPEVLKAAKAYDLQQTGLGAVAAIQRKYAGSAAAYGKTAAGATARYTAAVEELQIALGKVLLPVLASAVDAITKWVEKITANGSAQRNLNTAINLGKVAFGGIRDIIKAADTVTGGFSNTLETLFAILAVNKMRAIGGAISTYLVKQGIVTLGTSAVVAEGEVVTAATAMTFSFTALRAAVIGLIGATGIGLLVVAFALAATYVITHWKQVKQWFSDFAGWLHHALDAAIQWIERQFGSIVHTIGAMLAAIPSWLPGLGKFHDWGVRMENWGDSLGQSVGSKWGSSFADAASTAMNALQPPSWMQGGGAFNTTTGLPGSVKAATTPAALQAGIKRAAASSGVDPRVALALAHGESASGRPGDYGRFDGNTFVPMAPGTPGGQYTSFGPYQLHAHGALPAAVWAKGAAYANQWANSPAGLAYAMQRIHSATFGQGGEAAVAAAVTLFERPAKQYLAGEISGDQAYYRSIGGTASGGGGGGGGVPASVTAAAAAARAAAAKKAADKAAKAASAAVRKYVANLNKQAADIMKVATAQFALTHNIPELQRATKEAVGDYTQAAGYAAGHGAPALASSERADAKTLQERTAKLVAARVAQLHRAAVKAATASINAQVALLEAQAGNAANLLPQLQGQLQAAGIDPSSSDALGLQQVLSQQVADMLNAVRNGLLKQLQAAQRKGLTKLVASLTTKLAAVTDNMNSAVLAAAGYAQQAVATAANNALTNAQHLVTLAQGGMNLLQLQQQAANVGIYDSSGNPIGFTPAQLQAQAKQITGTQVPAEQALLKTLQDQLKAAMAGSDITTTTPGTDVGGGDALSRYIKNQTSVTSTTHVVDQDLVNSILDQISQVQQDLGQANLTAAQLIAQAAQASKQAAEDAAAAVVQHAGHVANMANLGFQNLQLQEQLGNTFGTPAAGVEQAQYITSQILPALQGELQALQQQLAQAQGDGNTTLAEQIAEAIAGKQNDILQASLEAQQATADATQTLADTVTQGSLGFGFGSESWTDTLMGAGVGA